MKYYYAEGTEKKGPYEIDELRQMGIITPDTLVWTAGMTDWLPASQVPELSDLLATEQPPAVPVAPQPAAQPQYQQPAPAPADTPQRKSRTGQWIAVGIVVVLLAVLFATNPSRRDHDTALKAAIAQEMSARESQSVLGDIVNELLSLLDDSSMPEVDYNNYFLCSTSGFGGETYAFGICGHVFVFHDKVRARVLRQAVSTRNLEDAASKVIDLITSGSEKTDTVYENEPAEEQSAATQKDDNASGDDNDSIDALVNQAVGVAKKAAGKAANQVSKDVKQAVSDALKEAQNGGKK